MEFENYWDIDAILAEEELILSKTTINARGLAFLEDG